MRRFETRIALAFCAGAAFFAVPAKGQSYSPCLVRPIFVRPVFVRPVFHKPLFEPSELGVRELPEVDNEQPVFIAPKFEQPEFLVPSFDRCPTNELTALSEAEKVFTPGLQAGLAPRSLYRLAIRASASRPDLLATAAEHVGPAAPNPTGAGAAKTDVTVSAVSAPKPRPHASYFYTPPPPKTDQAGCCGATPSAANPASTPVPQAGTPAPR